MHQNIIAPYLGEDKGTKFNKIIKMKFSLLSAFLIGSTSAFAPLQNDAFSRSSALKVAAEDMPGVTMPVKFFDPLGLSSMGSDYTLSWFRAAELKHSRVAMLATTGYLVQAAGIHFPGMLSHDVSFESLSSMNPFAAWEAVPAEGQAQIIGTIFLTEIITEAQGNHYTKGGDYPTIVFPPINFAPSEADKLKTLQNKELNNGRLAMIGIMSFICEANVPGSVPLLSGTPFF